MSTIEDRQDEAVRTMLALVRAALNDDELARTALLEDQDQRQLHAILHTFTGAFLNLFVRLNMAHAMLGEDEGAFIRNGAGVAAVLADPAARAAIEENMAATQLWLSGS